MNRMRKVVNRSARCVAIAAFAIAAGVAVPAQAQLNGENVLGDMGVKSGTQPDPGLYIATMYYRYLADSIKGPNGQSLNIDKSGEASQTINAGIPIVVYVSPKKIFGANYGMMAVIPFANGSLEAPGLGFSEKASVGVSDVYVQPLQLGWHTKRADILAGVALFAPTGRYASGESDNLGKGMWSYELSTGGTVYLDHARSLSVATTASWETHSRKDGVVQIQGATISDVKVGQLLTLEGGVGKSFLHGAATVGAAYYAQWKVTDDQMTMALQSPEVVGIPARHRVFGVGPDVTIPIATKSKLVSLVNVRYLWETGAEVKTQGQSLIVTATFPVGGISIPGR